MIGGNTRVNSDVPPFFLLLRLQYRSKGLNSSGLKRAGFSLAQVAESEEGLSCAVPVRPETREALAKIERELADDKHPHLVNFIRRSERGIAGSNSYAAFAIVAGAAAVRPRVDQHARQSGSTTIEAVERESDTHDPGVSDRSHRQENETEKRIRKAVIGAVEEVENSHIRTQSHSRNRTTSKTRRHG